jgi:ATP-dependent DNA helicase RecG
MEKHWVTKARAWFKASHEPIPHKINELDWKNGLSEHKNRLIEHLIAFSNYSGGGFLVFGVTDSDARLTGVTQEEAGIIINKLANLGRNGIDPPLALDHAVVEVANTPLLFIYIPELQRGKPAHRRGSSIEETWIRSGGTTRKASRHEIGTLLLQTPSPRWEDLRASPMLSAQEVLNQLDLTSIAKLLQRPLPENPSELMAWMVSEKMVIAESNGYYITHFGGIAAARDLDQFDTLSRKRARVIRYQGTNKVNTIDELLEPGGYAISFEGLITYLNRILPHSEIIQQSLRVQTTLYPERALRELLANALIHQDFNITGTGPIVEIFDNRIEFTNPGSLLPTKQLDRLIGTAPESRNETLASAFRRYRICEERGTGFQKIITEIELFGLPPLTFTLLENAFRVTLYSPRTFTEMSQKERMEACYQHAVLRYLSHRTLTNTTLRERFKIHEKQRNQITNLIADTVSDGRIKRKNESSGNKFAEYQPYWA